MKILSYQSINETCLEQSESPQSTSVMLRLLPGARMQIRGFIPRRGAWKDAANMTAPGSSGPLGWSRHRWECRAKQPGFHPLLFHHGQRRTPCWLNQLIMKDNYHPIIAGLLAETNYRKRARARGPQLVSCSAGHQGSGVGREGGDVPELCTGVPADTWLPTATAGSS
ncbi:hypothetical protein AAFF_G00246470 [Aldrovandia affinis]|uniref:Uncharacterized protein n=1 Tax=Aldrovandia affinis TaxID=143900 RepID=A0AAD7SU55_9TELE|nr:hypothetical protein AAFF_G00246470 [Aldrovandia affinis]